MNNLTLEFNNDSKKNTYANKKSHRNIQYMKRKTFTRLFCKNYGRFQLLLVMGKETIPHKLLSEHQKYMHASRPARILTRVLLCSASTAVTCSRPYLQVMR
jgi:hypothetical protein